MNVTSGSTASSLLLALLGTTCCALPIALVAFGLGGAVASTVSAFPVLITLSQYKEVTFAVTAVVLVYAHLRLYRAGACNLSQQRTVRLQKGILALSAGLFVASLFAAYALLPLVQWLESA